MKIGVSAITGSLSAQVDPRFGRCQYFVIVESKTMAFEAVLNNASSAMGGAGIQAAETVTNRGVEVVLTGHIGPNAFQVLSAARIKVVTGVVGSVKEAIERYKRGEFVEVRGPTVSGHFGQGRRRY